MLEGYWANQYISEHCKTLELQRMVDEYAANNKTLSLVLERYKVWVKAQKKHIEKQHKKIEELQKQIRGEENVLLDVS